MVASTTADYFVLYVNHDQDEETTVEFPVLVKRGEAGTTTLSENVEALPPERYWVEKYLIADPADVDGDCIDDITELENLGRMSPYNSGAIIALTEGVLAVPNGSTLQAVSTNDVGRSELVWAGRFALFGIETERPHLYFINQNSYTYHRLWMEAMGFEWNLTGWILGGFLYYPNASNSADSDPSFIFWMQFYAYNFSTLERADTLIAASLPRFDDQLALHVPNLALANVQPGLPLLRASRIPVLFDDDIYPDTDFLALNLGEGYGRLQVLDPDDRPHPRDIALYEALPNELPRVAGIISTVPQTPLSHVNLRAVQNGIPNAYIRDILDDPDIESLKGGFVHYVVTEDGWELSSATLAEVEEHYESSRPSQTQTPERDLTVTAIKPLSEIGFEDWEAFGVKAANVAVLGTLGFPTGTVPDGFAIPFHFYDRYMRETALGQETVLGKGSGPAEEKITLAAETKLTAAVEAMLAHSVFQTDFEVQDEMLDDLRDAIKDAETPPWITSALNTMHANYPAGQSLRYRSSTNNEHLPGFNGAGL